MNSTQRQLANKYIDLFDRQKLIIITLVLLCLPVGLVVYLRTPKIYEASSVLSYQRQRISPNRMSPDVNSRIRDIVSTLTQLVTSRSSLENIIISLNLYPEQDGEAPTDEAINLLRSKIKITPERRGDIFTISYSGKDPAHVVRVTNALASKFIEENLKYRQARAIETSTYTNEELQMAKTVMDKKENAMRDYKLKYYNEMPDQRRGNMSALTSLQAQYQGLQNSIQELGRTLLLVQDQISNRKKVIRNVLGDTTNNSAGENSGELGGSVVSKFEQIERLKVRLESLLMKYTEKHPEVKRVRKIIAKLETEMGKERDILEESEDADLITNSQYDSTILRLENQQKGIELNIANIKREKEQLKEKIKLYEQWVAAAPVREAEWSALTREYGQLREHYNHLISQNLQAESMLNLERRQKGSQFQIVDVAKQPNKPIKPNFIKIMGMCVLFGLGTGIGLTLVLDFFDTSFRDPALLEESLGIPLLTTIPYVGTDKELRKNKIKNLIFVMLLTLSTGGVVALFVVAWVRGRIVI